MIPFGVISDCHVHNWSAFSRVLSNGVNSRLKNILDEIAAAADAVEIAGGNTLYITGDLFHVRGSVSPMVLNPLIDLMTKLTSSGFQVRVLTGNHDLESRDSEALSNACESLRPIKGVTVVSKTTVFVDDKVVMVPWFDSVDTIRTQIASGIDTVEDTMGEDLSEWTLMLHAPVNGVLIGIPDNGFYSKELANFGFKRVFSGHYHNYKAFDGEVYSVGAATHQTWNDVGTKAGHIIVDEFGVTHVETSAPKFIDYDLSWDAAEASEKCEGNYVRVKMGEADDDEVTMIRDHVMGLGGLGCLVQAIPVPKGTATKRTVATVKAPTVRESINEWIKSNAATADTTQVEKLCMEIMDEVEAIAV